MKEPLLSLAPSDLRALAAAITSGRLTAPFSALSIQRYVRAPTAEGIAHSLQELAVTGISSQGLGKTLELVAGGMVERPPLDELMDLVTTGPNSGAAARDTSVVVRDLFHNAKDSVVVIGYAVRQGQRVFQALADRMTDIASLQVRMYLDIQRDPGDTSAASEIVMRFVEHFRRFHWPAGRRLPEIFYDPRSLAAEPRNRAALHAKCVVIDAGDLFVSSANFTEAGHEKNIEVGLLLRSPAIAQQLLRFFHALVSQGNLKQGL